MTASRVHRHRSERPTDGVLLDPSTGAAVGKTSSNSTHDVVDDCHAERRHTVSRAHRCEQGGQRRRLLSSATTAASSARSKSRRTSRPPPGARPVTATSRRRAERRRRAASTWTHVDRVPPGRSSDHSADGHHRRARLRSWRLRALRWTRFRRRFRRCASRSPRRTLG